MLQDYCVGDVPIHILNMAIWYTKPMHELPDGVPVRKASISSLWQAESLQILVLNPQMFGVMSVNVGLNNLHCTHSQGTRAKKSDNAVCQSQDRPQSKNTFPTSVAGRRDFAGPDHGNTVG